MASVYIVIENGERYPKCYSTYESARDAVIRKYTTELILEWEYAAELNDPDYQMPSQVDVEENESGTTHLYIEKGSGINIIVQQLT